MTRPTSGFWKDYEMETTKQRIEVAAKRRKRTPKKDLEAAVLKEGLCWLHAHGILAWRNNTGALSLAGGGFIRFGKVGSADITGILPNGQRLECEAKRRNGGKQSEGQRQFQEQIEQYGGIYILFHSTDELANNLIPSLKKSGVGIPLTQGKIALIDWDDYNRISLMSWHATPGRNTWYASGRSNDAIYGPKHPPGTLVKMHRLIMNTIESDIQVDHINRNGLDNRKNNLRLATPAENAWNSFAHKDAFSSCKGVSYDATSKRRKRWTACIMRNGSRIRLGYYNSEAEATAAYQAADKILLQNSV